MRSNPPDIAVPFKRLRDRPDPLTWVLRSVERHLPHGRVFLAGNLLPKWVNPETVTFVQTPQQGPKHFNIHENLQAVVESDISEDFVWFNDDFFILHDIDTVQLHHRDWSYDEWYEKNKHKKPQSVPRGYNFVGGMIRQWEVLKEWGLPTDLCTDMHVPMPMNRTRTKHICDRMEPDLRGHFRALYGAGEPSTALVDPKIKHHHDLPPGDWVYVSSHPASFQSGAIGKFIRGRYPRKSRYEL